MKQKKKMQSTPTVLNTLVFYIESNLNCCFVVAAAVLLLLLWCSFFPLYCKATLNELN